MSSAMAQLCSCHASVMTKDPTRVPVTGIFGKTEFSALQREGNQGGQVDMIVARNGMGQNVRTFWRRPGIMTKKPQIELSRLKQKTLAKRRAADYYDPDQLQAWFGELDW